MSLTNSTVSFVVCRAFRSPPGLPSQSPSRPFDHSGWRSASSAFICHQRIQQSLGWNASSAAETQAGRSNSGGATNLNGCIHNIRGAKGRGIETQSPNSAAASLRRRRRRRRSSLWGPARMAPEMSTTENVAAADGTTTAQNGQKETKELGAVFFDMDDTLVLTHEVDSEAHLAVMALVAVRAPQVDQSAVLRDFLERFKNEAWDPEHKVEVTEWRARLWGMALEGEGVKDMDLAMDCQNCFDRERLGGFRWTTGVERLVRTLHQQGIKVGIITNGHAQVQRAKLKACNAEELFDTILVGGEEPNPKPNRDIFLKACDLAGCKPEESIMVGDTLKTDIQGGINARFLSTVWVNVHKREPRPGSAKPDHEITTFIELQRVLEQYGVVFESSE